MNKAIIDIGSNTINVLIVQIESATWTRIAEYKNPARLGKGGLDKNMLAEDAIERGIKALTDHIVMAKEHRCDSIHAYATAAVRDAKNKDVFLKRVKRELNLDIEVIEGKREAELITFGIQASGALSDETNLILDIGGGSTEFIIIKKGEIFFKESYRLGVTRLLEQFKPSDPLSGENIKVIGDHINAELVQLKQLIIEHNPTRLVGASGSFDSLAQMSAARLQLDFEAIKNEISLEVYDDLSKEILAHKMSVRAEIPGLVPHRVETIPMAVLLIDKILENGNFKEIFQSSYALKEGAAEELCNREYDKV
ncbi:MAG: exopolyphosphatase/guanosine-5'-triphosphate,3'-diphosphate pyrophosphatase [Patiriisocius sp.]|jgi:exopolyphosphatase/guanosine-5'-triphosphate,3'-diphosphate pyrophosphatase